MAVGIGDIHVYGSALMAEDDAVVGIGGAIDLTVDLVFVEPVGPLQVVSSSASDGTSKTITLTYRDPSDQSLKTLVLTLNGTAVVTDATEFSSVLKGLKSASFVGDAAVEDQTATHTGTAASGSARAIVLDGSASAIDGTYTGLICRITSGTGAGQIRQVYDYVGGTVTCTMDRDWTTPPDNTSVFRLSKGVYFAAGPHEILTVRRCFYNASADLATGSDRAFVDKIFFVNVHATDSLTAGLVQQGDDPLGIVTHATAPAINDAGTNGTGTRAMGPAGLGFDDTDKAIPSGGVLAPNDAVGVWLRALFAKGSVAAMSSYLPRLTGTP